MPNTRSHGWPRATSLALLVPLLLSLPSCTTAVLWGAHDRDTHRAGIATMAAAVTLADGGVQSIAVRLAEDLPAEVAQSYERPAIGRWFEVRLREPSPAFAEFLRLRDEGIASSARFVVLLHRDDAASIEAGVSIADAHLAAVRLTPGMDLRRDSGQPTRLSAYASGVLKPAPSAPADGQPLADAAIQWWQPRHEPRPMWAKVALTPVTATMDVAIGPFALLAGGYLWVYHELGGRG